MILSDSVIVVTGAFGILGEAVTAALLERRARVALMDYATKPRGEYPLGTLQFGGIDLAKREHAATAMERVFKMLGRISGLVNCAGGFHWEKDEGSTLANWDDLYRLNLRTAVVACEPALSFLLKTSNRSIVNIGAMDAIKAAAGMRAYAASKAGVIALTQSLAEELKGRSVTVNAVLPSILDTPKNRIDMPDSDFSRWVTPKAVTEIICFLFSDAARAITGAQVPIAGRV